MIYTPLCGDKISRLGLGTMCLPTLPGSRSIDREASAALVRCALESGINFFDTAHIYQGGESERILGELLEPVRDEVYLADKYFILADRDYETIFARQLERLRTDHIDYYMLHGIMEYNIDDYLESGCIDFFLQQKKLGRIRHLGFSFHAGIRTLERVCSAARWDFAMLRINFLDWKYAQGRAEYEFCSDRGLPVIAVQPMGGGQLSRWQEDTERVLRVQHRDWSPAEWALRWFGGKRNVRLIVTGARTPEELREDAQAVCAKKPLNGPEMMAVNEVSEIIHARQPVQCDHCFKCAKVCPKAIFIPGMMDLSNRMQIDRTAMERQLENVPAVRGPSACDGCGKCLSVCEKHINITGVLGELAACAETLRQNRDADLRGQETAESDAH